MNELLKIVTASKAFGGVVALDKVNLSLNAGKIVGIVGASNSGKTTLLDAIGGIVRLDTGKIHFHTQDITHHSRYKIAQSGITRTFKYPRLFPYLTVHEHVTLQYKSIWKRLFTHDYAVSSEAHKLLEQLQLSHALHRPATELSAQQQRRIELAMALLAKPRLLLLDEPFTDYADSEELRAFLMQIQREQQMSILIIEHQMDVLRAMCHRVLIMNSGKIVADGKPDDILTDDMILETFYLV